jgi:hypothetical protein
MSTTKNKDEIKSQKYNQLRWTQHVARLGKQEMHMDSGWKSQMEENT